MATGTVKWFNNAKGYGFVLSEDKQEDLFIHYSSIQMDGYKSLKAGQEVEYDVQEGPKGMHAVNIRSSGSGGESAEIGADVSPDVGNEDNLHLNPMHSVNGSSTTSSERSAAQSSEQLPEAEVAVE